MKQAIDSLHDWTDSFQPERINYEYNYELSAWFLKRFLNFCLGLP